MLIKGALIAAIGLALGLAFAGSDSADAGPFQGTFRVTIHNLTEGQPLSPPVAATHRPSVKLFEVGTLASPEIEAIAEDGNQVPAVDLLSSSPRVNDVVDLGAPILAGESASFEIVARPGERLSLATMLICTNDGFTGLNGVRLPRAGSAVFETNAYDAGTEDNTQNSPDIVDPCSALGPVLLDGDDNGNENDAVDTNPPQVIHHHPGIHGSGDLDPELHGWTNPVTRIVVERID